MTLYNQDIVYVFNTSDSKSVSDVGCIVKAASDNVTISGVDFNFVYNVTNAVVSNNIGIFGTMTNCQKFSVE